VVINLPVVAGVRILLCLIAMYAMALASTRGENLFAVEPVLTDLHDAESAFIASPNSNQARARYVQALLRRANDQKTSPPDAVRLMATAMWHDGHNPAVRHEFEKTVSKTGRNPTSASDLAAFGDSFLAQSRNEAAAAMYTASFRVKQDPGVLKKFGKAAAALNVAVLSDGTPLWQQEWTTLLQRRIKRQWFPSNGTDRDKITLEFDVTFDGKVSSLTLVKSGGRKVSDDAALRAVIDAQPLPQIPFQPNAPDKLHVLFEFDYNVYLDPAAKPSVILS
jgi:TonB family protein